MKKVLLICFLSFFFIFNSVYSYITPTLSNTNNCFEPIIGTYGVGDDTETGNDLGRLFNSALAGIFFGGSCPSDTHFYADYGICLSVEKPDGTTFSIFFENGTEGGQNANQLINVLDSENLYNQLVNVYNHNTTFFDLSGEYKIRSSYITGWRERRNKMTCEKKFLGRRTSVSHSRGYHPTHVEVFATMNIRNLQDVLNRVYIPNDWDTNSTIIYCNGMNDGISLEPDNFKILGSLSDLYKGCLIKNLDKDENNTIMMGFKKTTYYDISEVDLDNDFSNLLNSLGLEASDLENLKDTRIIKNTFDDDDLKILFDQTLDEYKNFYSISKNEISTFQNNVLQLNNILDSSNTFIKNIKNPDGTLYENFYIEQYKTISNSFESLEQDINRILQELNSLDSISSYEDKLVSLNSIKNVDLELYNKAYEDYNNFISDTSNNINDFEEYSDNYYVSFENEYAYYLDNFNYNEDIEDYKKLEEALIDFKDSMVTMSLSEEIIENYVSIPSNFKISNSDSKSKYISTENDIKSYIESNLEEGDSVSFISQVDNLKINYKENIDEIYLEVKKFLDFSESETSTQSQVDTSIQNIKKYISTFQDKGVGISLELDNSLKSLEKIIENYYYSISNIEMLESVENEKDEILSSFSEDILRIENFIDNFDKPTYYKCDENRGGTESVDNCFHKVEKVYSNDREELSNIPMIFKFNDFMKKSEEFRKSIYNNILTRNMIIEDSIPKSSFVYYGGFLENCGKRYNSKIDGRNNNRIVNYVLKSLHEQRSSTHSSIDCSPSNDRDDDLTQLKSYSSKNLEGDFLQTTSIDGTNFDTYNILKKYPINYYKKDFEIDGITYSFEYDDVSTFFILKNFNNVDLFEKNKNNKLLRENIANKIDSLEESKLAYISVNAPNTNLNLDLKEEVNYNDPIEKIKIEVDRNELFKSTDCNILTREDENIVKCGSAKVSYKNNNDFPNFFFNFMDTVSNLFAKD